MDLPENILHTCRQSIAELEETGAMPAGHNGPYFHWESALRNTSHWLFCWSMLFKHTGEACFRDAVESSLQYVTDPSHRQQGGNWLQRSHPGRDSCNGVIGAAWTGEALWAAGKALGREDLLGSATDVLLQHTFHQELGLWHRWEVDGRTLSIDQTFNHQLWFAATAARCGKTGNNELFARSERFMDQLETHFVVQSSGLIQHRITLSLKDWIFRSGTLLHWSYNVYRSILSRRLLTDTHARDVGYHCFNLIAFAVLKQYFPDHPFWSSSSWVAAWDFAQSEEFASAMNRHNKYAFPYNPAGFELAATYRVFQNESEREQDAWISMQWDRLTDGGRCRYGDACEDPMTARARIYEGVEACLLGERDVL